jgi:hypothetical protein
LKGLPASLDWRTEGIVTSVKDQMTCGSCWAFGTVGVMESALLKSGGPSTDLSEQFLVSCNKDGWSCAGGLTAHKYHTNVLGKNQSVVGAVLESVKPYTDSNGTCTIAYSHPYKLNGWQFVAAGGEIAMPTVDQIKNAIYTYGPVTAGICAGNAFSSYPGGVFSTNETCPYSTNHQIILVGWDDSTSSWILKNSWGSGWGESGYMRIAYNTSRVGEGTSWVVINPTTPRAPVLVSPLNGSATSDTTPQFKWNSTDYAQTYHIQLSTSSTFATILQQQEGITGTVYTATTLADGKYYWRVRARNSSAYGPWSVIRNVTVDTQAPVVPVLLLPANGTTKIGTPTFSWKSSAGASRYQFEYGTSEANPDSFVYRSGELATLTHKPPVMAPHIQYYWFVRAGDAAANWSAWSAAFAIYIEPTVPVKPVLNTPLNNAFTNDTTPELTWKSVAYGDNYHIQISKSSTFPPIVGLIEQEGITGLAYTPGALAEGKYYWRVRARNVNGAYGPWSYSRYFTVDTTAPLPPVLLAPAYGVSTVGTPTFSWKASAGAKYYQFEYGTSEANPDSYVYRSSLMTTLTHKPPVMTVMIQYYWFVRASDAAGNESAWSASFAIMVIPPLPARVTLNAPASGYETENTSFMVGWNAVAYGHTYEIQVDDLSTFASPNYTYTSDVEATSKLVGPLATGKWYWRVRAQNKNGGYGAWSAYRNFIIYPKFNTQFNTPGNFEGWVQHPGAAWGVSSGYLYNNGLSNGYTSSASYGGATFNDFTYEARLKMDAPERQDYPNIYGLVLRGTPAFDGWNDWINAYYFEVFQINSSYWGETAACYGVKKITNGKWTFLTPFDGWWCYPWINYADYNTLKVYMKGSTLKFYVNGNLVLSKSFSGPVSGRLGVYSTSWDEYNNQSTYVDWAVAGMPLLPTSAAEVRASDAVRFITPEELGNLKLGR